MSMTAIGKAIKHAILMKMGLSVRRIFGSAPNENIWLHKIYMSLLGMVF